MDRKLVKGGYEENVPLDPFVPILMKYIRLLSFYHSRALPCWWLFAVALSPKSNVTLVYNLFDHGHILVWLGK